MIKFTTDHHSSQSIESEEHQNLLHQNNFTTTTTTMRPSPPPHSGDRSNDVVKLTNGNVALSTSATTKQAELITPYTQNPNPNNIWRDSSYDFTNDGDKFDFGTSDTTSPQQSPALSKIPESPNNYGVLTPKEVRVSFHEEVVEPPPLRQRSNGSGRTSGSGGGGGGSGEEVVVCSANGAFKQKSSLMRTKTNSRLMDPPEPEQRSGKTPRAGGSEFDEEDPFLDDDLPDEYKQLRYSKWTILQLLSLILIIAALICTLTIPFLEHMFLFDLESWKWGVMILVLICGRLVSGWGIRFIVVLIERNFVLRKRVLYFVYGLRKAVQNCVWLTLVLIAWQCIFNDKVERATKGSDVLPYVTKVWVCLLVATVIWLLKTLLVKVLASSFHVSAFFDRIQESLFNQYVIESLSGPPLIEIQHEREEEDRVIAEVEKLQKAGATLPADLKANIFKKSGRIIGTPRTNTTTPKAGKSGKFSEANTPKKVDEGITIDHLHRLNQKNISAWNMKRLMNIVRTGVLSTLDEQLEGTRRDDDGETAGEITNEKQAKVAAKKIFNNVAKQGSKRIYLEDLMRFLREDEALKAIRIFDAESETEGISKGALKNWVVNVFRERRALALSLNDTKTAVNKLHQMLNVVVGILIIMVWLLILKVATTKNFIFLSSQLLLVVFVFGNTCKTTFEAIVFLFVMHPYDVGDRCEIDGVQMVVEEMNILTTVFLRYDNQKIIYPNSVLATKPIANYYRSPDMGDAIDFCIHVSTPVEKVALMKERITSYIENKSDHWYPAPLIVVRDVEDMNRLKISIWLSHRMNFQDMGERWQRRALLVEEMIKIFRELDIEYRMLPVDINVRNMPTLTSNRLPSNWLACTN